ncbi:hypothetical protein CEP53_011933 [Fusarium sp. AF-6]|nr:hypothetical protein CEP53_011933 [Fusarium sp. AF-6]
MRKQVNNARYRLPGVETSVDTDPLPVIQVARQIELKQDSNSKAILVFTIVTVIFLPLSFVTSFFGMNTADLRDMDLGQWLFWAVSIPVTVTIVGFAMTIAYQGDRIREFVARR